MSCSSAVRTIVPPVAGTRLTQTRMFTTASRPDAGVLGVEQRPAAGDSHCHVVALAEVFDDQLCSLLRLLRWEVGHQQVFPDRRSGAGAVGVRATAPGIDEPRTLAGQDPL